MAGFEIFNERGYKIAGTDYPNLVLRGKGMLTLNTPVLVSSGFDNPQYIYGATLPTDGGVLRFYRIIGEGFIYERDSKVLSATKGVVVEYYSFGPVSAVTDTGTGGLEIYAPDGRMTFCTHRPFLKILGVWVDPTSETATEQMNTRTYAMPTGIPLQGATKVAFSFGNPHYFYRLYRFADRGYSVSYAYNKAANVDGSGYFRAQWMTNYWWVHSMGDRRVWEIPNGSAPQRIMLADVSNL